MTDNFSRPDVEHSLEIHGGMLKTRKKSPFRPGHPNVARAGLAFALLTALALALSPQLSGAELTTRLLFEENEVGKPPSGWACRNGSAAAVYSICVEEGKKYLHADARSTGVQIGREITWHLRELPILQWQWRAVLFPRGGDERKKATNDSVLGLYVIFGQWPLMKVIKYVWSETLPVGTCLESPFFSGTKIVVVESGHGFEGQWVIERRDVLADFRRLFGSKQAAPIARGIGILTDADNTGSHAIGDYGDIEMLGIHEYKPTIE
jgi:hypothetical protein